MKTNLCHKPWSFKEGLIFGCGLLVASILLQTVFGNIDWRLMAWPINAITLCILIVCISIMQLIRKKVYLFAWLSTKSAAVCSMAFTIIVTIVLGLIAQSSKRMPYVPWYNNLTSSWPFVTMYVWLTLSLGLTILKVCLERWTLRTVPFLLNHLGLFITIVTATLGNADMQQLRMIVGQESIETPPQSIAYNNLSPLHEKIELDFSISLKDFQVEYYTADSTDSAEYMAVPKSFKSYVNVFSKDGDDGKFLKEAVVQVNKPLDINGWKIYLYDYNYSSYPDEVVCMFQIVRDPWLPCVYVGIFMMLAGALTLFLTKKPKSKQT